MNGPMMRQVNSWVPIAPLPSSQAAALAAAAAAPHMFHWDRLGENDVLLRKGGRPTHGKVKYFRFLQGRAGEYASYKSPIDRRLLARELVDSWLRQGGRFCSAVTSSSNAVDVDVDRVRGATTTTAAAPRRNHPQIGDSSLVFRVASTEEALQFTRRVLVRHFTPTILKRTKSRKAGPPSDARDPASPEPIPQQLLASPLVPVENVQTSNSAADRRPAVVVDLELATNEAADALCCLRSTGRVVHELSTNSSHKGRGEAPPTALSLGATPQRPPARVSPTNHP